jgi:hypothetical protein
MTNLATLTVADRIALSLDGLARAVAARIAGGAMAAAMIVLVWTRLRRVDRQIKLLLERFAAGRLRGVTAQRSVAARGRERAMPVLMPRGFGWLLAMVPHQAACYAGQLRIVLAEPEMVALLEASPQARRALRPLCRMLGLEASLLRSPPEGGGETVKEAPASVGETRVCAARVRAVRAPVDFGRIPLPRGVLAAARRQGYGKR